VGRPRAVVLLSGGLDSTTCLYWAMARGFEPSCLIFDYGQRHRKEVPRAARIARRAGCDAVVTRLRLNSEAGALLDERQPLPARSIHRIRAGGPPPTYVPGRNTIFLSYALSLAESRGAGTIIIGTNQIDSSGYPDCRAAYLAAFQRMARRGSSLTRVRVLAPLARLRKRQIIALAVRLGVPLEHTWSCYAGGRVPCGRCDACRLRAEGFAALGRTDPAGRAVDEYDTDRVCV